MAKHFILSGRPSDGTNRREPTHYVAPNWGRAQGNYWHERNYSTGRGVTNTPATQDPRGSRPVTRTPMPEHVTRIDLDTAKATRRTTGKSRTRAKQATTVWVPEQTDLQRHAATLGNNNHNNH